VTEAFLPGFVSSSGVGLSRAEAEQSAAAALKQKHKLTHR